MKQMPPPLGGPPNPEPDFKPWEQRPAPGLGGASSGMSSPARADESALPPRLCQEAQADTLAELIERQTDLVYYPMVARHSTPEGDSAQQAATNAELWQLFVEEHLYDTRRVRLEHFHLFEWFPLAPGRFHTAEARQHRQTAYEMMFQAENGRSYFNPAGKADMIKGGLGAVRLRPRLIGGEPHYWMSVSSNGVCHEGFPVLVPRRFYGPLKAQLLVRGAVPVSLGGEMRYIYEDAPTFFAAQRQIPQLYLHVDELELLPAPRAGIEAFSVSVAISFLGQFDGHEGIYATYATFDPAQRESLQAATQWLEQFYVVGQYQGLVITDFDEVQPRFAGAVFGLPDLMAGKLTPEKVAEFLQARGYGAQAGQPFFVVYKEINTMGGAYIEGDVHTGGGDFIGRDKNT
jgi:hypothetical protein